MNLSTTIITIILAVSVSPSPIPDQAETERERDSFHLNREKRSQTDVENSISNIAAQLLLEEEPTSLEKLPKFESNSENQAKVVDHIKGLLSDIVTNTVVDDNTDTNMLFIKNNEGLTKSTPTILQTVYGLDSNTIKDKESFIKIINKMTEREKETTEGSITTNYVSVFDHKKNNDKGDVQKNILDQYLEYYDQQTEEDEEIRTTTETINLKSATSTTTTSSTTTSTTTTSTTTSSTTTSTTPTTTKSTTTTEQTTTTTTAAPTLLERAGSIVTGSIGGLFDGFASLTQAFTPFWIPIQLGRKRRDVMEEDTIGESITDRDIFMNFLLFQKRIKAMNPAKLNTIVAGVVKSVINTEPTEEVDEMENIYDEIIARQVTELLLRPKPFSKDIIDSSVSENYL